MRSLPRLPLLGRGRRVVLGFSGGVDSALAAHALKAAGFDVLGVFMRNWEEKEEGHCKADQEEKEAAKLASDLRISFDRVDFTRQYWNKVFQDFLHHSATGMVTPNPDVFCNREIKFTDFLSHARTYGVDFVATGHYARIDRTPRIASSSTHDWAAMTLDHWAQTTIADQITDESITIPPPISDLPAADESWLQRVNVQPPPQCLTDTEPTAYRLLRGVDLVKDQSYFLSMVRPHALDSVMFPLGNLHKHQVRALARDLQLPVWNKKGSVGICFIGKRPHADFLAQFIGAEAFAPGPIVCVDTGKVLGRHKGFPSYTIGQAAKLAGQPNPYFVCGKQPANAPSLLSSPQFISNSGSEIALSSNSLEPILWVAPGHQHPALYWRSALVSNVSFVSGAAPSALHTDSVTGGRFFCHAQFRRARQAVPCVCSWSDAHTLRVTFASPQFAVTPGQALVLYRGDECLGGGVINASHDCALPNFGTL